MTTDSGEPLEMAEAAECPVCLAQMQVQDRVESTWLVCPNGCPTEFEPPARKPAASVSEPDASVLRASAGGFQK